MLNSLPAMVDPFALAKQGGEYLSGSVEINKLSRLADLLALESGEAKVELVIGKDEFEPVYIQAKIEASLLLTCQRCGKPVCYDINVEPKLSPVLTDAAAANVAKDIEPWVTYSEPISVADLVEEELLLSLPMIAKHKPGECEAVFPQAI